MFTAIYAASLRTSVKRKMHCLIIGNHRITYEVIALLKKYWPVSKITSQTCIEDAIAYTTESIAPIDFVFFDHHLFDEHGLAQMNLLHEKTPLTNLVPIFSSMGKRDSTFEIQHRERTHLQKMRISWAVHLMEESLPVKVTAVQIKLTPRQKEMINLVLAGYSNKKIAETLNLSSGTIKNYMFELMRILSVKSRLEMATKILTSGIHLA